jgi:hypothetical protein
MVRKNGPADAGLVSSARHRIIQKRHMTAADFGDLFNQLAQRWGIDTSTSGNIVTAAQQIYTCTH